MPIYEYQCENCGNELEIIQKISDEPLKYCPSCESDGLKKKTSMSAFHLKGGGWYKDGYGDKNSKDSSNGTASSGNKESTDKPAAKDKGADKKDTKTKPDKTDSSKTTSTATTPKSKAS